MMTNDDEDDDEENDDDEYGNDYVDHGNANHDDE